MLKRLIPLTDQLAGYNRETLYSDLMAGLTVGVMLIPQGMAYALIAGMPPIYGLYASLTPIIVYALLGTSRQLSVAPVAMMSLLTAAGVAPLAGDDIERYIALALLLALLVGVIQFSMGLFRFGFLTNFLSHPILVGFTSAAALIIGFSQLKHLLGVDISRSHYVHEIVLQAIGQISEVHAATLIVGLASIALLVGVRRWKKSFPGALVAVALSTLAVWGFSLQEAGVYIVGAVPRGLPHLAVPVIGWSDIRALFSTALAISVVGFMESIAVAKVYASKNRYDIDANKELIGLGLANVAGSFFQAFPTTGGFSRTAVNAQAGARTQVAGLFTVGIIGLTLLFLTPLFYYLPNAVLAAIVMVAVSGLIDWCEGRHLWQVDRKDFSLMVLTFVATLVLGIEQGILAGVAVSILVVIHQSSRPHTAIEGRLPGTRTYRNVARNPEAQTDEGVTILRIDDSLYFANVTHFKEQLKAIENEEKSLRAIVLNFFPVNRIDSTAAHVLKEIATHLKEKDIRLIFAGVKGPVMDVMKKSGLVDVIGLSNFFLEVHDAVLSVAPSANGAAPNSGPLRKNPVSEVV